MGKRIRRRQLALQGSSVKLLRAHRHIQELDADISAFGQGMTTYKMSARANPATGEKYLWLQPKDPIPGKRWGAIIGDIVHNLRSALDHAVWTLTEENGHKPPPDPLPRGSKWRDIQFPIMDANPQEGWAANPPRQLWGLDGEIAALVETTQPFQSRDIVSHPLWLLREMSNIDKHRAINIVGIQAKAQYVSGPDNDAVFRVIEESGELGAELGRIPEGQDSADQDVTVSIDAVFEDAEPTHHRSVFDVVWHLYGHTNNLLNALDWKLRRAEGPPPVFQWAERNL